MAAIGNHGRRRVRPLSCLNRYQTLEDISSGTYGVVRKALDSKTNEIVAIKEEYLGLKHQSTEREIAILQSLPRHPSIVEFRGVFVEDGGLRQRVFVVMEYAESDLSRLMKKEEVPFAATGDVVKTAVRQILDGVAFLHDRGVMHRDIKPANILVAGEAPLTLKLCDFGLSRNTLIETGAYTPEVVTRWYRAPELLVGDTDYSPVIDVWSVGCVMAEMVLGQVLFPGESDLLQLGCIMSIVLGRPGMLRAKVDGANDGVATLTAAGIDLLERMLAYDHEQRITARDALNHEWFKEA